MLAIGLMSGTSLDGVDAALVDIEGNNYILRKFITLEYDEKFKRKLIRNLDDKTAKLSEICSLNFELGYWFVAAIDKLLAETNITYDEISFVASHGQTIWHNPHEKDGLVPSTLQIGEGSVISNLTGIDTIYNFRSADIACGGEGAPLVPMSEYILFRSETKNRILQNIGGIGNLTFLKRNASIDDVVAFDTGPGNVMIDYFVKKYFDVPYDANGEIAKNGKVIKEVFDYLCQDEFLEKLPPKSTGREKYSVEYMEKIVELFELDKRDKRDVITTFTYFTAYSICESYKKFILNFDEVIVSGGGSHNEYIIEKMQEMLNVPVYTQDELGYSSDAKEAIAFVILGYLTLNGRYGNIKSATGANKNAILGCISLGKCENDENKYNFKSKKYFN